MFLLLLPHQTRSVFFCWHLQKIMQCNFATTENSFKVGIVFCRGQNLIKGQYLTCYHLTFIFLMFPDTNSSTSKKKENCLLCRHYYSPGVPLFKMGFWVVFNSNLTNIWPTFIKFWSIYGFQIRIVLKILVGGTLLKNGVQIKFINGCW